MATIKLPTKTHSDFTYKSVYLRADDTTVNRYCTENSIGAHTYTKTNPIFSNDGGWLYYWYDSTSGGTWKVGYDYIQIVDSLNY